MATRQQKRAEKRAKTWARFSGANALRDDKGIIPRAVRRDMAGFNRRRKQCRT
jgi:hypothetical protein